jgi:hypothetical protein
VRKAVENKVNARQWAEKLSSKCLTGHYRTGEKDFEILKQGITEIYQAIIAEMGKSSCLVVHIHSRELIVLHCFTLICLLKQWEM